MPIAQRVDDVPRQPQAFGSPLRPRPQAGRDGIVDEKLRCAVAADRPAGGREHRESSAVVAPHDAEVEGAAPEIEHEARPRLDVRGVRGSDRFEDEADLAKARELGRRTEPVDRATLGTVVPDEADGPAECDRFRRRTGELVRAVSDVDEDQRDEVLQALRVAKNIRAGLKGIAQERFQCLEKPSRGACVGVDVRLDRPRGLVVARCHPDAEELELTGDRPARSVVLEVRVDRGPPNDGSPIPPDVEDSRHGLASNGIDR